jgi:hypothetical protein
MKRGFAAQFSNRNFYHSSPGCGTALSLLKGSYTLFEFIPRCPESRDFRFTPTNSGEFKFKNKGAGPYQKKSGQPNKMD